MAIAFDSDMGNRVPVGHSSATGFPGAVPAPVLLRRLGWYHRRVGCRDCGGRRAALHVWRRAAGVVEVQLAGGEIARLSNVQAGALRAVLRDVLIDEPVRHDVLPTEPGLVVVEARRGDGT